MPCNRSGMCCSFFYLPVSPETLKEYGENYKEHPYSHYDVPARMDEMARMLEGRCWGKSKSGGYYYGPCRNLVHTTNKDGKTVASCLIHDNKPYTCKFYPNYPHAQEFTPESNPLVRIKGPPNPAMYKGCGFNQDPEHGQTVDEMKAVLEDV